MAKFCKYIICLIATMILFCHEIIQAFITHIYSRDNPCLYSNSENNPPVSIGRTCPLPHSISPHKGRKTVQNVYYLKCMLFVCFVPGENMLKRQFKEGGVYFSPQLKGKRPNVCGRHGARSLVESTKLHLQSASGDK